MAAPLRTLALAACLLLMGAGAQASPWLAELEYELGGIGSPAPVGSAIGVATVNGSGGGSRVDTLAVPGGLVSVATSVVPTFTTAFSNVIVSFTPASGTFARPTSLAPLAGQLPVPGNVRICLFLSCAFFADLPLTQSGTRGVGIGGAAVTATLLGAGTLSIVGADWTGGTTTITGTSGAVASAGFAHGPLSFTGSTAAVDGVLRLVTPVPVAVSSGGPPAVVPVFGALTVHFLPEPGVLALLVGGSAGIALIGRFRARR